MIIDTSAVNMRLAYALVLEKNATEFFRYLQGVAKECGFQRSDSNEWA